MTSHGLHRVERLLEQASAVGLVLGIDTAASSVVLGLVDRGVVRAATIEKPDRSHAASLPFMAEKLLERAGAELAGLDGVAVGIGPGSFTGVRIALSYGKGIAFARRRPLVGVSCLETLAVCALDHPAAQAGTLICAVIDARLGQFYAALYRASDDGLEQIMEPALADSASLSAWLSESAIAVGDDAVLLDQRLCELNTSRGAALVFPAPERRAAALAAIGAARIAGGCADSLASLEPIYVRAPQVQPRRAVTTM